MGESNKNHNVPDKPYLGADVPAETSENTQNTVCDVNLCREMATAIDMHFRNLQRLIKITKTKDDSIQMLSSELQKYRSDYCAKLIKPLALALINFREGCRKSLLDLQTYTYDRESTEKYVSFIYDEYTEILSCQGILCEDGVWTYNGKPLQSIKDEVKVPEMFEPFPADDVQDDNPVPAVSTIEELMGYLDSCEQTIRTILADNEKTAKLLQDYIRFAGFVEEDIVSAGFMPFVKRMAGLADKIKKTPDDALSQLSDENYPDEYGHLLSVVVSLTEEILLEGGVEIWSVPSDEFDPKKHRLLRKIVISDDADKDKKIAQVHTECYMQGDIVIYPSKVDVYVYENKDN